MKLNTITTILALSCGGLFAQAASAQTVDVQGAWARATVPGQKATGAFMKLTAKDGTKLVSVSTPAAGVSEVHEMKMDGDVMDLKAPLPKDSTVALTLVFKDAKGVETKQEVTLPVSTVAPVGTMAHSDHKH